MFGRFKKNQGFTLIEILLVVVIIGLMLAVIVPRAYRANIEAKYGLVRQAASELASYGTQWIEEMTLAQRAESTCRITDYLDTLVNSSGGIADAWIPRHTANWVGTGQATSSAIGTPVVIVGRKNTSTGPDAAAESTVEDITPPDKWPMNPFGGSSYYTDANLVLGNTGVIVGAITPVWRTVDSVRYYAFLLQGTDSRATGSANPNAFHAGQDPRTEQGLRNGIFWIRSQ